MSKTQFYIRHTNIHSFTKQVIAALNEWKLVPFIAELVVADEENKVATAIDAICLDKKGRVIVIEWKTGLAEHLFHGNAFMTGPVPIDQFPNSPLNQAKFQLTFSCVLLAKWYGMVPHKAYVVVVNEEGVMPYEIGEVWRTNSLSFYRSFISTLQLKKLLQQKKI